MFRIVYLLCVLVLTAFVRPLGAAEEISDVDEQLTDVVVQDGQDETAEVPATDEIASADADPSSFITTSGLESLADRAEEITDEPVSSHEALQAEPEVLEALEQIDMKSADATAMADRSAESAVQEVAPSAESVQTAPEQAAAVVETETPKEDKPVTPEQTQPVQEVPAPASPEVLPSQQETHSEQVIPQPPKPTKEPLVEDVDEEPKGIDTVDISEPEGNWLFKRIWWEKSKKLFGKIRDYVDQIVESRMRFFEDRVKLDHERLDPFYISMGMDQGTLTERVNHLLEKLEVERVIDGVLDQHELDWFAALTEEKETLKMLSNAIDEIQRVDAAFDDALKVLMQQINLARSYEREAWQLLNRIAEELSDKKAREDYYAIATLWRNVKDIGGYITGPWYKYFVELATSTVERLDQIEQAVNTLKEKGIELTKEVESHEHDHDGQEEEPEMPSKPAPVGWLTWIWQTIVGWFTW